RSGGRREFQPGLPARHRARHTDRRRRCARHTTVHLRASPPPRGVSWGLDHQRSYAGWPGLTATKVPLDVAHTFPPAVSSASTTARSSAISTTRATISMSPAVGVGRRIFTAYSAVTVVGGLSEPFRFMR